MDDGNGIPAKLLLILLLVFSFIIESVNASGNGEIMCIEKERQALLRFKQALEDDKGVLASWGAQENNRECCKWKGVTCSDTTHHVIALLLRDEGLRGNITQALLHLHDLDISRLDLSANYRLQGHLPPSFGNFGFNYLNLSHNQFTGTLPDFSSRFVGFPTTIDVSFNNFSGFLPLFHPNISVLHLSRNMFRGPISSICSYTGLGLLDLSYNQLSGQLPPCLMNMMNLLLIDIANNTLSGEIPLSFITRAVLILRNNNLSGELPPKLQTDNPGPGFLTIFDVGGNQLTGTIPTWLGNFLLLKVINLRDNKFHGIIPPQLCNLVQLQILDLSRNNISGTIPRCFNNFSPMIEPNIADGTLMLFPAVLFEGGSSYSVESYIEHTFVNWRRKDREFRKIVGLLTLIDLSSNKLDGNIPKEFSLMKELVSLNLSRNHLAGNIVSNIGQMNMLECLDLSSNQLSGNIPVGLADLTFLSVLDLSNNKLSGRIPSGHQLQTFDASTYAENDGLCGRPLDLCPVAADPPISLPTNEKHNYFDKGFYIFVACGFVLGFGVAFVVSLLQSSWMNAFINSWRRIWDWMYVMTVIHLRRLR